MRKFMFPLILVVILLIVGSLGGCGETQIKPTAPDVYESLAIVGNGYGVAMVALSVVDRQGGLNPATKAAVIESAEMFCLGYQSLLLVLQNGDTQAVSDILSVLSRAGSDIAVLIAASTGTNTAAVSTAVAVLSALGQIYLAPAISAAISNSEESYLTADQVTALQILVKPPEDYFTGP
jgi:hypothetical protein